ncbi:hypothetical protein D3C71_1403020 [compost metagenome]
MRRVPAGDRFRNHAQHVRLHRQVGGRQDGRRFNQPGRGRHVVRPEFLLDHVAHRAAVRLQDPRIRQHRLKVQALMHGLRRGQRMVHRRDHGQRLVADRPEHVVAIRQGQHAADHHIQLALVQAGDQQVACAGDDLHGKQRIGLLQAQQRIGQMPGRGRHDAADEQLAGAAQPQFV